ncbi:inter-alpha-trypsin inhibitor heavy chain H4-like [Bicyclus anynana]|uniref:Inter-alpha-trypsin inhibitor heavy chain H4-like n=1 Tax=Bicyclus anynana TaxID=110368 RepID=A0ABM3M8S3_BICAN|nr:inter-alpha-trypsin inhibitor heavy chain H4-like [Bicyclus anynana]
MDDIMFTGRDADTTFLRKLALRNNGFSQYLYEDYDTGNQLVDMYRKVSSPLLSNVKFHYPSEQIQIGTLSRNQYHIINAGSEIVVVGKLDDDASEYDISPYVTGYYGSEDGLSRIPYEVYPRVTVKCGTNQLPLERLWAYLNIKQLLDERDATDDEAVKTSAEKKALNIALKYEFVTPLTSLVVVKPNATNAVDLESADKQPSSGFLGGAQFAASPAFVSNAAVSRAAPAMLSKTAVRRAPGPAIQAFIPAPAPAVAADALQAPDVSTIPSPGPAPGPAPVLAPEAVPAPTPDPAPASPLDKYHLQNFKWTSSILNKNISALVFENNGIQITLDLTEDINVPKEAGGDAQCSTWWGQTSVGANTGNSCVYLTRCRVAQTLTVDEYSNSYCVINNSYAGVCCPNNEVDKP